MKCWICQMPESEHYPQNQYSGLGHAFESSEPYLRESTELARNLLGLDTAANVVPVVNSGTPKTPITRCTECLEEIDSYFEDRSYGRVRVFINHE